MMRVIPAAILALALSGLAGCAVGPDYERPDLEAPAPAAWAATMNDVLPDSTAGAGWRWWEEFGDATLNALVDSSLVHNHNLAQAVANVLEARAAVGGAESARWPSVEIGGSAARAKSRRRMQLSLLGNRREFQGLHPHVSQHGVWAALHIADPGGEAVVGALLARILEEHQP